jgi:large subunit ribosomal protein L6
MSRVGKKPILIPENVEVKIESQRVTVKGPKGELQKEFPAKIGIELNENKIFVSPRIEAKKIKALWGTSRVLLANMIKGVAEGFEKKLEIEGLGYKATLEGPDLILSVGFSHLIKIKAPPSIKFSVEKNIITISGIDKELVGQIAAKVRKIRPPEPYKGKGIRYVGEVIRRKAGKKVITTAT